MGNIARTLLDNIVECATFMSMVENADLAETYIFFQTYSLFTAKDQFFSFWNNAELFLACKTK